MVKILELLNHKGIVVDFPYIVKLKKTEEKVGKK